MTMADDRQAMLDWIADAFRGDDVKIARETAAYNAKHDAIEAAHGVTAPPPKTAEQAKEEALAARFPERTIGENLAGELRVELDRIGSLVQADRDALVADLRKQHGDAGYQALLDQAQIGLNPGGVLTDAQKASKHFLNTYGALGRYRMAAQRARSAAGLS
jgi:hypothetical protein